MISILLFTGCGENSTNGENESEKQEVVLPQMEDAASLSYEVPQSTPSILINRFGYETDSTKTVEFMGSNIPEFFEVIDKANQKSVYKAKIEPVGYSEEYEQNIAIGDFSEIETEGTYIIKADYLGESYSFRISDNLYTELLRKAQKVYFYNRCGITLTDELAEGNVHNACHLEKSVLREDMTESIDVTGGWHQDISGSMEIEKAAGTIGNLLLAYEIFPDLFTDDIGIPESGNEIPDILDEVRYEIEWFLKMQNSETGGVYSQKTVQEKSGSQISYIEPVSIEATEAFAYVLAKFSYLYQKYDVDYATKCLKAADVAWRYSSLNDKEGKGSSLKAAAAAELYRASGMQGYHDYLNQYFSENIYSSESSDIEFLTSVTYLNTKKTIDRNVCESIMKSIMKEAENISLKSRNAVFSVPFNKEQTDNDELLKDMMIMSFVDYIISNHEYDTVISNYLDYFLGKNPMSISYFEDLNEEKYSELSESQIILKDFENDAKFLFMLCKIMGKGYAY